MKAMIVDDDRVILALLSRIFHRRGYEVVTYADPTACPLYLAESCQCPTDRLCPMVIVSDYLMPSVNGVEFIEALRKKGCRCSRVALISGNVPGQATMERLAQLEVKFFPKTALFIDQLSDWLNQIELALPLESAMLGSCRA